MNCELYEDSIMKNLDGEIDDIENNRLMKHLSECNECRRKLEDLKNIMSAIEQTDIIEPPCDLEQTVMEKVKRLDIYNKRIKEKKIIASYFIAIMMFSAILVLSAILFKENIFGFMLVVGAPKSVTYMVYEYLSGLDSIIAIAVSCIKVLKGEIADFNYLLLGMLAIIFMEKVYEINLLQRRKEKKSIPET